MIQNLILSLLAGVCAALTIVGKYRASRRMEIIFKPLTMLWIILIVLLTRHPVSSTYQVMILGGLLASLVGDIVLMMPGRFREGLASFLVAHCFYIAAFMLDSDGNSAIWYIIPFVLYGVVVLWRLWPYLGSMKAPVMVYVGVIMIMAWQAANRWLENRETMTLLALVGAYLFVASDSVLAVERFRGTWRSAPFWVLSTYFVAQWLFALSV
jgi:uncharacterized membrane protein YhhN